jgi:hypothetical protein
VYALLAVYAFGVALPVVLPLAALGHTLVFTLHASQGPTHHSHQVVSLVLLTQSVVVLYHHFFVKSYLRAPNNTLNGWLLWHTIAVVCGAYMVSVISKVWNSGGEWIWNSHLVALDLIKAHRQDYFSRLYPWDEGDPGIAIFLLGHPWIARMVFSGGMLIEFFSFMALGGRVLAFIAGVALIAMHRGIAELMSLEFRNFEMIELIYFVNLPFLLAWLVNRVRARPPAMSGAVANS